MTPEAGIRGAVDAEALERAYALALADVDPGDGDAVLNLRQAFGARRRELGLLEDGGVEAGPTAGADEVDEAPFAGEESPPSRWWWAVLLGAIYLLVRILARFGGDS